MFNNLLLQIFILQAELAGLPPVPGWIKTVGGSTIIFILYLLADTYLKSRTQSSTEKKTDAEIELEKKKLSILAGYDLSKLSSENQQKVVEMAFSIAKSSSERADTMQIECDSLRKTLRKVEEDFQLQLDSVKEKQFKSDLLLRSRETLNDQYRQRMRYLCDLNHMAYWTISADGKFEANQTFIDITGFGSTAECQDDKWFEAIDEKERESARWKWKNFTENHVTRPVFSVTFRHLVNPEKLTRVKVYCEPVMADGMTVFEFTARTAPIRSH